MSMSGEEYAALLAERKAWAAEKVGLAQKLYECDEQAAARRLWEEARSGWLEDMLDDGGPWMESVEALYALTGLSRD